MARLVRLHAPQAKIILGGHGTAIEGIETAHRLRRSRQGRRHPLAAHLPGPGPRGAHLPPDPAERPIHEDLRRAPARQIGQPARPRPGLRQRLQVLQHLPFLRPHLHPVPVHRQRAVRDRLPHRGRAGIGRLLRHGRELPQGPDPGHGIAAGDGGPSAILRFLDLLLGRSHPGLRRREPGPAGRQVPLDGRRDARTRRRTSKRTAAWIPGSSSATCAITASRCWPRASCAWSTTRPTTSRSTSTTWSDWSRTCVQFMLLIPLPVTDLYRDHQKRGLLKTDLPFEDWHGQKTLNFNHPAFPGDAAERWIKAAFRQDYEENSSSMYRIVGDRLPRRPDPGRQKRNGRFGSLAGRAGRAACGSGPSTTPPSWRPSRGTRSTSANGKGPETWSGRSRPPSGPGRSSPSWAGRLPSSWPAAWKLRLRIVGDGIQPRTIVTRYPPQPKPRPAGRRTSSPSAPPPTRPTTPRMSSGGPDLDEPIAPVLASGAQSRYKK